MSRDQEVGGLDELFSMAEEPAVEEQQPAAEKTPSRIFLQSKNKGLSLNLDFIRF